MAKRVLIAEDDPFIRKLLEMNLENEGWDVIIAHDGLETIAAIREDPPDILLLDILMPGMDGLGVLEVCHKEGIKVQTIILSNLSQNIDQERAKELGAVDYMVKSELDIDNLIATVHKMLGTEGS